MSVQERKDWERAQRRARIIDEAERKFLAEGYAATTLPAIAAAAGYHKRNLYFYFRDKEALFMAVAERALIRLKDRFVQAPSAQADPVSNLVRIARTFFDFAMAEPGALDLIMQYETVHHVYEPSGLSPDADPSHIACQHLSDQLSAVVREVIDQGQQAGTLRCDLEPRAMMLLLWGQILGVVQVLRMREKSFTRVFGLSREALFDRFVDMMVAALKP